MAPEIAPSASSDSERRSRSCSDTSKELFLTKRNT
uniref:Uncharacterized protein n=1 Tax=Oryza sativa subsp. japonica TaxID=39947 RepID=Q2QQG0_ORYSJ|nr:hypothetical protein LOC_Os12g31169 [Oryza sativa Japonica Group]